VVRSLKPLSRFVEAEVDEGVLVLDRIDRDLRRAGRLLFDQLHLERLAAPGEEVDRVLPRPHFVRVGQVLRRELLHLLLDRLEVLRDERARNDEVVVEAVVECRPDAALDAGEEVGHRGGEQVRRAVTVDVKGVGAAIRQDLDAGVGVERERQVDRAPVNDSRDGGLGQPRRDQRRDVGRRTAGGHLTDRSVRQRDGDFAHGTGDCYPVLRLVGTCARSSLDSPLGMTLSPAEGSGHSPHQWPAMSEPSARQRRGGGESNGRREWSRTTDLLRVKQAL